MEELFRFSVLRPANRSKAQTLDLQRPPSLKAYVAPPPPMFQQRLQVAAYNARPTNDDIWSSLLNAAQQYLLAKQIFNAGISNDYPFAYLNNPASGQAIYNALESFSKQLQVLNPDKILPTFWPGGSTPDTKTAWAEDAKNIALAFFNKPNKFAQFSANAPFATQMLNWRFDLSDIFLALLILRANGLVSVRHWVLSITVGSPSGPNTILQDPNDPYLLQRIWTSMGFFSDDPSMRDLGDVIRVIDLLLTDPKTLNTPDDLLTILNQTLMVPEGIFTRLEKPIHAIGLREFHVVKQHIRGYQLGEIADIENILKGESRDHSTKHTLSNETDTFNQTTTTTEKSKELDNTDHVDIKNETDSQVKEDTKVDGGVHATISGGDSYKLQTDLSASYDKSSDNTKKFASDVSKDVTTKVASKVTTQITQSQTTKIIETWEENEDHSFDNKTTGKDNISGIYQWVEKVYLCQTFTLGRHLVFDITVPEPGASLLAMATVKIPDALTPSAPLPLIADNVSGFPAIVFQDGPPNPLAVPLRPDHLRNQAIVNLWVARYLVTGVPPPASPSKTVSKSVGSQADPVMVNDVIQLDDGYLADSVAVTTAWRQKDDGDAAGQTQIAISVGTNDKAIFISGDSARPGITPGTPIGTRNYKSAWSAQPLNGEAGSLPVAVSTVWIASATVDIEITCTPSPELLSQWQQQVYDKIIAAWQKLQDDYMSALKGQQMLGSTVGPLGASDTDANRLTERLELKRSCIAIIDNDNNTVRGVPPNVATQNSPDVNPPQKPDPNLPLLPEPVLPQAVNGLTASQALGARVRWFEQAFEWENIAYICYPYFWGRRSQWVNGLNLKLQYDDPLFMNFLRAGYARVVVPVRLGFEAQVHCYLHLGRPWLGGECPLIGDKTQNALYLDIAEEIKANTGGGETGELDEPVGDPWEYKLPTTLIKLRKDGAQQDPLPSWVRVAQNPNPKKPDGSDKVIPDPNYPTDPPIGHWTWKEENPPISLPFITS